MYSRELDGQVLTLGASGWTYLETFVLYDQETNSMWWGGAGPVGSGRLVCVAGEHQDQVLPVYDNYRRDYWRNWYATWPETLFMKHKDW